MIYFILLVNFILVICYIVCHWRNMIEFPLRSLTFLMKLRKILTFIEELSVYQDKNEQEKNEFINSNKSVSYIVVFAKMLRGTLKGRY